MDEEEGALEWTADGRRGDEGSARAGDGRGCRRRKVEDFLGAVKVRGGSGAEEEEEEGEGESGWLWFPSRVGMSGSGGSGWVGGVAGGGSVDGGGG